MEKSKERTLELEELRGRRYRKQAQVNERFLHRANPQSCRL